MQMKLEIIFGLVNKEVLVIPEPSMIFLTVYKNNKNFIK